MLPLEVHGVTNKIIKQEDCHSTTSADEQINN